MATPDELVTKVDDLTLAVVETPTSPSSGLALSRFEFETGKANEGTKILMVEWDGSVGASSSSSSRKAKSSDWDISWDGKTAVLYVRDAAAAADTCRVYFLLPPGAAIPPLITITRKNAGPEACVLRTKPMPAIFPAGLGGGDEAGRRGVLHTIWAKLRMAELDAEIEAEAKENGESVGLEMAVQERLWIIEHFGLKSAKGAPEPPTLRIPQSPMSPASPRSPIGGRLGEKLKGLKLATSPLELAAASNGELFQNAAKTAPPRMAPLLPPGPSHLHDSSNGGVGSLNAIVGANVPPARTAGPDEATEEELFALPMSPRSPEMKRSPFSLL
ncbi:hypothetical protein B0T16DRAFT_315789 [Cercophora newfieldiana]|uniref:Uncharacterized protein n=1 Tax=Cercophora newfieldiana TaxID=92897 RepID=A0AA39YRJ9_9PEZI|nr:hypothetical protein B0T16DRAFT_315789 [Cercophora newfieldiana]